MTLFEHIKSVLSENEAFCKDGTLFKNAVVEAGLKLDPELLKLLLKDDKAKKHFFSEVDGIAVFDKAKFQKFVSNKQFLPDSFTAYKNKIGLTANGEYLTEANEVVLDFPYKDCVLEGGQTKEDQKRQEIFWNETLAPDEIDRLFEPKVLTNWKRYDKNGEQKVKKLDKTDNLIIKGNNLLALHSLLPIYKGKVKLIYIDPPYNTGSDSFQYNDNFTESTWLTFILNRLKAAKKLIQKSGVILVQINDHNQSYLKALLDSVFGKENFINKISVRTKSPSGFKTVNLGLFETAEYILMYGKSKNDFNYNQQYEVTTYDENYTGLITNIEESPNDWIIDDLRKHLCREYDIEPDKVHQPYSKLKKKIGETLYYNQLSELALKKADSVFRLTAIGNDAGKETLDIKKLSKKESSKVFVVNRDGKDSRYILNGQEIAFYSKKIREIDGVEVPTNLMTNIWTDIAYEGIASEGGVTLKKGKKPEKLLRRIIEMATNKNDLVLDYHLGSGTTCAVAHKLGRQYIGLEQLDYGKNDSSIRLQNVINGDTTGISKVINWQGGGSFVYAELAKDNAAYVERIQSAKDDKTLLALWEEIKDKPFISYKVNPQDIDSSIDAFQDLSLDDQKKLLISLLDKNQLYVNYNDIKDADHGISKEDKALNQQFYSL